MWYDFRWIDWNRTKIDGHDVSTEECEWVVSNNSARRAGDKYIAIGRTRSGRPIKVIYLIEDDRMTVFVLTAYDI